MIYDHIRDLPLVIDEVALDRLALEVSPQFTRVTTLVLLRGGGHEGVGEDVTYEADEAVSFAIAGPPDIRGEWTIHSLSQALDAMDLFPAPPAWPVLDIAAFSRAPTACYSSTSPCAHLIHRPTP